MAILLLRWHADEAGARPRIWRRWGQKIGDCDKFEPPVAAFHAHWALNDLKIYKASLFPKSYQGGAFIAFHGSWNRALGTQGGYNVVFQPLSDGKSRATTSFSLTASRANPEKQYTVRRAWRWVSMGRFTELTTRLAGFGASPITAIRNAPIEAAPTSSTQAEASPNAPPPEGVHPAAGALDSLPSPPGATAEQVALGKKIFDGEVAGGTCAGCHGANGIGTSVGADLASGMWLWGDGSLKSITDTIKNGVPQPKQHPGAVPTLWCSSSIRQRARRARGRRLGSWASEEGVAECRADKLDQGGASARNIREWRPTNALWKQT